VQAIADPDNPTNGHVFTGGVCNQSIALLRFRILNSGSGYTSFMIPLPSGMITSTSQPNDTVVGTNPDPVANVKTNIMGAKFTTSGANPHGLQVTAENAMGATSQHTITVPGP
jgi:hypothetical protein